MRKILILNFLTAPCVIDAEKKYIIFISKLRNKTDMREKRKIIAMALTT